MMLRGMSSNAVTKVAVIGRMLPLGFILQHSVCGKYLPGENIGKSMVIHQSFTLRIAWLEKFVDHRKFYPPNILQLM